MTGPRPGPRERQPVDASGWASASMFFERGARSGIGRRRHEALAAAQVEVQRLSSALGALGGRGEQDLDLDAERFFRQVPVALGALDRLLVALGDPSGPQIPAPMRRSRVPERVPMLAAGWPSQTSGSGAGGSASVDPAAALVSSSAGGPVGSGAGDGAPLSSSPASVQLDDFPAGEIPPGAALAGDAL